MTSRQYRIIISWWRTFGAHFQALANIVKDTITPCIDVLVLYSPFYTRFRRILSELFPKLNWRYYCGENSTELPVPTSIFQINLKYQYIEHIFKERERDRHSLPWMYKSLLQRFFFNKMWRNQNRHFTNSGVNLNFLVISHYSKNWYIFVAFTSCCS